MTKDTLDYKEPITTIYLVRHGETRANKLRLIFGHLDWDLTDKGKKQAKKASDTLTKLLKKEKVDFIVSSPLLRAKSTTKIINKKLKIKKIIIDKNLIEKSEGIWEGKNYWEIRESNFKNYLKWLKNPVKYKPLKGESIDDMDKRIKTFYQSILKKYSGKTLIIVSHAGPIRVLLLNLLGSDLNKFWSLNIGCGSISKVLISKNHSIISNINLS